MSVTPREQHALDSIGAGLAGSDPDLASLLTAFTRLASGEKMPATEEIRAGGRQYARTVRRMRRRRRHPRFGRTCARAAKARRRLGWQRSMLLLWLVIAIALTAVALAISRSGSGAGGCARSWAMACAAQMRAEQARSSAAPVSWVASEAEVLTAVPGR